MCRGLFYDIIIGGDWGMNEKVRPIFFYIIFFLFLLAFSITFSFYDYDLWARLIAGMGFIQTGHVLKHDFLSYTPTHIWYDHEWGSGVIFYLVQHFFDSAGILLLQVVLMFLLFFIMTKIIKLRGVKTTSAYNFLFYYSAFMAMAYLYSNPVRCQMFTFVFFALFLYILELARKGENRPLFAIPFIMIIWNNLHGGCTSGIGLIFLYAVGEYLSYKPFKKYVYALISSIVVLPINPWGFEYLKFLLKANTMPRRYIVEWWSPFSKFYMQSFIEMKAFILILILFEADVIIKKIISRDFKFDYTKILVLATTLYLGLSHVKLMPFAVISFSCFLYDDFYTVFNYVTKDFFNKIAKKKDTVVYAIILLFAVINIHPPLFSSVVGVQYPVREIEFIKINHIKGNLLVNFGAGSYASYKLYPQNKIFIDGRYEEVYYDYMMPLLFNFHMMAGPDWDRLIKLFPPDVMVMEKSYPVYLYLTNSKEWKLVFAGNSHGVFVPAKSAKKMYLEPSDSNSYYKKTNFDTDINFMLQSEDERKK